MEGEENIEMVPLVLSNPWADMQTRQNGEDAMPPRCEYKREALHFTMTAEGKDQGQKCFLTVTVSELLFHSTDGTRYTAVKEEGVLSAGAGRCNSI